MRRIDAAQKSVEGEEVLKFLTDDQIQFLKELSEQAGADLLEIFDILAVRAKETIYYLSKERKSVDELVEVAQKQNFHSGRVSMLLLLDYLLSHAGTVLDKRSEKPKK
ncbi:MAG: hypothetical protein A2Y53_03765 [Chloroflexi bacterium RBG_16_47_49]|nr:MAG: hypothetical protein A2Y53_03765 [Chloroflexi bacterium RBG_16_47_49]